MKRIVLENILKNKLSDEDFAELVEATYNFLGNMMYPEKEAKYAECRVKDKKIICNVEDSVYKALKIDALYLAIKNGLIGERKIAKKLRSMRSIV